MAPVLGSGFFAARMSCSAFLTSAGTGNSNWTLLVLEQLDGLKDVQGEDGKENVGQWQVEASPTLANSRSSRQETAEGAASGDCQH